MLSNYVLYYAEAEDGLVYSVGGRGRTFPSHINAAVKQPQLECLVVALLGFEDLLVALMEH